MLEEAFRRFLFPLHARVDMFTCARHKSLYIITLDSPLPCDAQLGTTAKLKKTLPMNGHIDWVTYDHWVKDFHHHPKSHCRTLFSGNKVH